MRALCLLYGEAAAGIDRANAEVVRRLDQGVPQLVGVGAAGTVVPGVEGRTLLHCGPTLPYAEHCDPLRRSMRAAVVAEGWADDVTAAEQLLRSGGITLAAANEHAAVVPMASAIGPSQPMLVVTNRDAGTTAFAPVNQGPGDVAWFGGTPPRRSPGCVPGRGAGPAIAGIIERAVPLDVLQVAAQGIAWATTCTCAPRPAPIC